MNLLKQSIETLQIEIDIQENDMKQYIEQNDYSRMVAQEQYLAGLRKALSLVEGVYSANDWEGA